MVGTLIALAAFGLVAYAIYLKRSGFDRVLAKAPERPELLKGLEVQAFFPILKSQPGWLSPSGKVSGYEGDMYIVDFSEPWRTEYGNLSSIRVRSGMDGNPLSKLAAYKAGTLSIPIIALLSDGREIRLELGAGYEPDGA